MKQIIFYIFFALTFIFTSALIWQSQIAGKLYYCIDQTPILSFIPPFVHKEASLGQDHYIASPSIVYLLWTILITLSLTLPILINSLIYKNKASK